MDQPGPAAYLEGHLHQLLTEDPRVGEQGISVRVTGDDVFLSGLVASDERRDLISEVVAQNAGDHRVHNAITVLRCPEPTANEVIS
jgi:osmotically-inducible protein OsmY